MRLLSPSNIESPKNNIRCEVVSVVRVSCGVEVIVSVIIGISGMFSAGSICFPISLFSSVKLPMDISLSDME